MNARELLHFFRQRCCYRAQWEIRSMAEQMYFLVKEVAPNVFVKAGPACLFAPCPEGEMSCGRMREIRKFYGSAYREGETRGIKRARTATKRNELFKE